MRKCGGKFNEKPWCSCQRSRDPIGSTMIPAAFSAVTLCLSVALALPGGSEPTIGEE